MKYKGSFRLVILLILQLGFAQNSGALQWHMPAAVKLDKPPIDAATSLNGKRIFVLTADGNLHIYTHNGKLTGTIPVGKHVDGISVSLREDLVMLLSKKNSTVQSLVIDFVQNLSSREAPYKGPANAPVIVTVFSDFQ